MNICECATQSPNAFGCCSQCGNVVIGRGLRSPIADYDFKPARSIDYDFPIKRPESVAKLDHASINDKGEVSISYLIKSGHLTDYKIPEDVNLRRLVTIKSDIVSAPTQPLDATANVVGVPNDKITFSDEDMPAPTEQETIDARVFFGEEFKALLAYTMPRSLSFTITDPEQCKAIDDILNACAVPSIQRGFDRVPVWGWRYGYNALLDCMGWEETDDLLRARFKAAIPPQQPDYLFATGEDLDNACWPLNRSTSCLPVWGWEYSSKNDIGGAYWYSVHSESDVHLRERYVLALTSNWRR